VLRGLITWQWAPDCRPARQAGQLLGLTRLGSIFYSPSSSVRVLLLSYKDHAKIRSAWCLRAIAMRAN